MVKSQKVKFELAKKVLKEDWGLQLFRGGKSFGYGFSTGYIVIGKLYQKRFNSLKEIMERLNG